MIALDTSAVVAIALSEPEEENFNRLIAHSEALVGTPTLLEARMVLTSHIPREVDAFLAGLLRRPAIHPVAFTLDMHFVATEAFLSFGKGRHPAKLNFGDCMAYAVAKVHDVALLYKGKDFAQTDIRAALT